MESFGIDPIRDRSILNNLNLSALPALSPVIIRPVSDLLDPARAGFADLYAAVFGEPPYREKFPAGWIEANIWPEYLPYQAMLAETKGTVVGFACGFPLMAADRQGAMQQYLESLGELPFDKERCFYLGDLGVCQSMRGQGLGRELLADLYEQAQREGSEYYLLRTAERGSSALQFYLNLGGELLPGVQVLDNSEPGAIVTAAPERVYIWGRLEDVIKIVREK